MQFILDNLVATIVASAMALVLLSTRHTQIEQNVERVRHYAARQTEMNFVEVLRSDMRSAVAPEDTTVRASDSTFSFQAVYNDPVTPSNVTEQVRITYKVKHYTTISGRPLYYVERKVTRGNTGVALVNGLSYATGALTTQTERVLMGVTSWSIVAKNASNSIAGEPSAVRRYSVAFELVGPYTGMSDRVTLKGARALSWNATYSPPRFKDGFLN